MALNGLLEVIYAIGFLIIGFFINRVRKPHIICEYAVNSCTECGHDQY